MDQWKSEEQKKTVKEYSKRLVKQYSSKGSAVEAKQKWEAAHCLKASLSRIEINEKTILEQAAKEEENKKWLAKKRREERAREKEEKERRRLYVENLMNMSREDSIVSQYVDGILHRKI